MFGAFERRVTLAAMNFPAKRWIESQPRAATRGSEHGAIHSRPLRESILEKMLKTRGISSEQRENFLHPATKNLAPARDMHGMVEAARLICAAVRAHRKIAIYGDYDVDGVMATAILWHMLRALAPTLSVRTYVPHRIEEGYGLNRDALRTLRDEGIEVVITVDCGVSAVDEARYAQEIGLELIITDHHELKASGEVPVARAVVHPRLGDTQHFGEQCGAGVAWKLATQLMDEWCGAADSAHAAGSQTKRPQVLLDRVKSLLPLAAIGTVADVVPMLSENRIIVARGLPGAFDTGIDGLNALLDSSRVEPRTMDAEKVAFRVAPRINACGRMGHAEDVVELFTTANASRADEIVAKIDELNTKRRADERAIFESALAKVDPLKEIVAKIVGLNTKRCADERAIFELERAKVHAPLVDFFTTANASRADEIVAKINELNTKRCAAERAIFELVLAKVDPQDEIFAKIVELNTKRGADEPAIFESELAKVHALLVDLFTTANASRADEIVAKINELNAKRWADEHARLAKCGSQKPRGIVVWDDAWNLGVVGIVCSKLVDLFACPVIIITRNKEGWKGSGRSIKGIELHRVLEECSEHLQHFGGHAMAAGVTIESEEKVKAFRDAFVKIIDRQLPPMEEQRPTLDIDCVCSIGELDIVGVQDIEKLAPFGRDNRKPVLLIEDVEITQSRHFGKSFGDKPPANLELALKQSDGAKDKFLRVQWWNGAPHASEFVKGMRIDVVVEVGLSTFGRLPEVEARVLDLRLSVASHAGARA